MTDGIAIHGTVTRSGQPVEGADILVMAWPSQDVLDEIPDGGRVPTRSIASVKSDANGNYAIPLDVSALPSELVSDAGQVDVDVKVADKASEMEWGVSLKAEPTTDGPDWIAARDADRARSGEVLDQGVTMAFDLGTGAITDSTIPASELVDDDGVYLSEAAAAEALHVEPVKRGSIDTLLSERRGDRSVSDVSACTWIGTNDYQGNRRENFVIVRGTSNAKARLYQIRDAEHTVGVAVKNGTKWEAGGTRTRNWENETSQGGIVSTKKYYNHVRYRKYLHECGGVKWVPNNEQEAIAGYVLLTNPLNYNNCSIKGRDYTFTKTKGKNTTYSGGMELSVLDVSAQSGWGSKTKIKWEFTDRAKICWSSSASGLEYSARVITKPA